MDNFSIDKESWIHIHEKKLFSVWDDLKSHIFFSLSNTQKELLQLISISSDLTMLDSCILAQGTVDHIIVEIRKVTSHSLRKNASYSIVAHNHTSGDPTPSINDISYTKSLNYAFRNLDIQLIDHYIVGTSKIFSLRQNCLIF